MILLHYLKHKNAHVIKGNIEAWRLYLPIYKVTSLHINVPGAYERPLQSSAFILSPDAYKNRIQKSKCYYFQIIVEFIS